MKKEGDLQFQFSKYVLLFLCVKQGIIKCVCPCVNVQCFNVFLICQNVYVRIYASEGAVGGLENVRNVQKCNQNVLLCRQKSKKDEKKKPRRRRNTVAGSWE